MEPRHAFVNHNARVGKQQMSGRAQAGAMGVPRRRSSAVVASPMTSLAVPSGRVPGPAPRASMGQPCSSPLSGLSAARLSASPPQGDMGGFGIAGVRTGEEVIVAEVERRQPRPRDMNGDAHRDAQRIKSLQAEVKQLQEKLKKSQAARGKYKEQLLLITDEMEKRRALELAHFLQTRERALWELSSSIAKSAHDGIAANKSRFDREVNALQGRIDEFRSALADEQRKQDESDRLAAEARREASEAMAKVNTDELAQLKEQLAAQELRFAREKQKLEQSLAETQNQLRISENATKECLARLASDAFLVAQCRLFVKQVCQPGFNVVKGVDLEPVDKNRTEPTGYVLVPLIVLLHGYTLLPADDRKEVIDQYEAKVAATGS